MPSLYTLAHAGHEHISTTKATTLTPTQEAAVITMIVTLSVFLFILFVALYVFIAICLMKIFKKARVPSWAAWVPIYNAWKFLEIGGQQGFWAILAIIPIVNIVATVFLYIAMYHVGKNLGKGGEFVLWGIFLPYVWFVWLAFDKSTWKGAQPAIATAS